MCNHIFRTTNDYLANFPIFGRTGPPSPRATVQVMSEFFKVTILLFAGYVQVNVKKM